MDIFTDTLTKVLLLMQQKITQTSLNTRKKKTCKEGINYACHFSRKIFHLCTEFILM